MAGDCPRSFNILVVVSTLVLLFGMAIYAMVDPQGFTQQMDKDHSSALFEHLTVLVLIPGIICGLFASWRYRALLPNQFLTCWVIMWSLACIYFAGEEASWGQWYFGWETPQFVGELNDQGETNLHNMSSWLDQKPRALVEIFILFFGFVYPLSVCLKRPLFNLQKSWLNWLSAPLGILPLGLVFTLNRIADWFPYRFPLGLSTSELREFFIAWFFMCYLISYLVRFKALRE